MARDQKTSPLLELVLGDGASREMRFAAARGVLPVSPVEIVEVLVTLTSADDPEIAEQSRVTLAATDVTVIRDWVEELGAPDSIDSLAKLTEDSTVIEAVIRSRRVLDETLIWLGSRLHPDLQEVLAINQTRLLRDPRIMDALRSNPRLTGDVRRRIRELQEEFFDKEAGSREQKREQAKDEGKSTPGTLLEPEDFTAFEPILPVEEEVAAGIGAEPGASLFEEIELPEEGLVDDDEIDEEKRVSLMTKIQLLSVSAKIQLANKGNKEARGILIRDSNKLVSVSAVQSPRITGNEIEMIATMRNVHEDVLRHIATNREWSKKYAIFHNLLRNPKAPAEYCISFIVRMNQKDMKSLSQDKGVSELVRTSARRLYQQKYQQDK